MREKKKKETQLDLNLHNARKNVYYKYKKQYDIWLASLETKKFIKDPFTWFSIITSISLIATQLHILKQREYIPKKIPIFNYFLSPAKRLAPMEFVYFIPILCSIIVIISIILSNKYYHTERELAKVILIVSLLSNTSLCMLFIKLSLSV